MTNKIATKQYCNTIQSNSFTDDLTRCPRHEDIVNVGLLVTGLYRADQLIPEDVISANINYITVSATSGEGSTIIKAVPKYNNIPQSTIDNMILDIWFITGKHVQFGNYAWDEDNKWWYRFSWESPDDYGVIDLAKSTISISEDSKYKYALAKPEAAEVLFKFVLDEDLLLMAFNKRIRVNEYKSITTSAGEFEIGGDQGWYSYTRQEVTLPFDVNSIKVINIPDMPGYKYVQGEFPHAVSRISSTVSDSIAHYNGSMTIAVGTDSFTSGTAGGTYSVRPSNYGDSIYVTYNASTSGHTWDVKNAVTGNTYTLNPGVSTYVGMATGDILLEFRNYK